MSERIITKQRESNFELLRLFAMFCIIVYHLLGVIWHDDDAHSHGLLIALQTPFHIGVPLFVMISGYFGIRASWRGVLKILVPMFIYYVPIALVSNYVEGGDIKDYIHSLMFLSQTEYWFVQTYLWLFAFSPAINLYIKDINLKKRITIIGVLAFITMYVGNFGNDPYVMDGKDVIHFILLYIIGDTLHEYRNIWENISWKKILTIYLLLNVAVTVSYFWKQSICVNFFFPYNSIGIIINSILAFILFGKIKLVSSKINYMAASSFVVYLVHGQPTLFNWQMDTVVKIYQELGYGVPFIASLLGFSFCVMVFAIGIDKCLVPLYNRIINMSKR